MVQVETGDEAEGTLAGACPDLAEPFVGDRRLEFAGLATKLRLLSWAIQRSARSAEATRGRAGAEMRVVCRAQSLRRQFEPAVAARRERLPSEITELRCGEALLLGRTLFAYEAARRLSSRWPVFCGGGARGVY